MQAKMKAIHCEGGPGGAVEGGETGKRSRSSKTRWGRSLLAAHHIIDEVADEVDLAVFVSVRREGGGERF